MAPSRRTSTKSTATATTPATATTATATTATATTATTATAMATTATTATAMATTATSAPALRALLEDAALAGTWTLDPAKSAVALKSRSMWGLAPVKGVFRQVRGSGTVAADGTVSGTVTVAAASVDTRIAKRDAHLRSADFFDSDAHPDITFAVTAARPSGPGATVAGNLTVRDRTLPLTFEASVAVAGDGEIWLDAQVPVNRAEFGLTWSPMGMASMHSTITVHAVFTRS